MTSKQKLTFLDKIILAGSIIAIFALVLGSLAGNYDPREHIVIAFAGLAYPYILLTNIILIGWWILRKQWILAVVTIAVIFMGKSTLTATFNMFGNAEPKATDAKTLRVMTYNVHSFKEYGGENTVETKRKMLRVIEEQQPDVICFQEFYTRFSGEYDLRDSIKKMLKMPYVHFVASSENKYEAYGMAIFSKYPIENRSAITFNGTFNGNGGVYTDIRFNEKLLRVYNVHLRSISFEKQDYSYLDKVTKEINPDKQSSKRIYRMLRGAFKGRAAHVDVMKAELAKCELPYILAGDFNDTPASYAVKQLTGDLNNAFIAQGSGLGCTYNGKFPNFQIDYIAATKDIDILSYKITEAKLSDHFPVRADVKFK